MRSMKGTLAIVLVLLFTAGSVRASCPNILGPYGCCGVGWYLYEFEPSCAYTIGDVSATTMSCYNWAGYSFDHVGYAGAGTVSYSYTIGANDPVLATWSADVWIDFDDPNDNYNNVMYGVVTVMRGGSQVSSTLIFSLHGTDGPVSCDRPYANFSAQRGDTIYVEVAGVNYNSNTVMKVAGANVFTHT